MTYPPQQPGPYGPQDPYGQQPPQWGQQPGYPMGPPPKKSRTGLITALVIVAVLVVGGGGVAAYLLLKDDNSSTPASDDDDSPRATADAFVEELGTAVSTKPEDVDLDPLKPLTCKDDFNQLSDELQGAQEESAEVSEQPEKTTFTVTNFKESGDGATFDMTQKRGEDERDPLKMDVEKEDGHWVACGIYKEPTTGGEDGTSSTSSEESANDGTIPNPIPKTSS